MIVQHTHDNRPVYASDSELPPHAIGWTQCEIINGCYAVYMLKEDQERAQADYREVEKAVQAINNIAQGTKAMQACGFFPCQIPARLKDVKLSLQVRLNAQRWPLRLAK